MSYVKRSRAAERERLKRILEAVKWKAYREAYRVAAHALDQSEEADSGAVDNMLGALAALARGGGRVSPAGQRGASEANRLRLPQV